MRVVYCRVPELLNVEMHRLVEEWVRFLPGWVALLTVDYDDSDPNSLCAVNANYVQRAAFLSIHPSMVNLDRGTRDMTFLHELGHALHAPVDLALAQILETNMGRKSAERVYEDAVEAFVNDYASLILIREDPPNPGGTS